MRQQPAQPATHHPDGTPLQLGRYRLVRPISTGGMARVFEGRREGFAGVSPRVAVKVILPNYATDEGFRDLFINEARIGSLVRHGNLVQIQDFDCEEDRYYLVMEYVEGLTLRRIVNLCRRHGVPVTAGVVAEIGRQICEGLDHLHSLTDEQRRPLGLVHRDIKPSNVIVDPQGVAKVLDFGVAVASGGPDQRVVRGTWGYMAPEQALGKSVGAAADIFALAAVLYELAALEPLFPESEPDALRALMASDEAARRAVGLRRRREHDALVGVLVRALQRDPDARYSSAAEMGRSLMGLVGDPVSNREQLVRLVASLTELNKPGAPAPERANQEPRRREKDGLPVAVGGPEFPVPDRRRVRRQRPQAASSSWSGWIALIALPLVALSGWLALGPRISQIIEDLASPEATQTLAAADLTTPPVLAEAAVIAPVAVEAPVEDPAVAVAEVLPEVLPEVIPAALPETPPEASPVTQAEPPASVPPMIEPAASAAPATGPGHLTISAIPRARVLINGEFVRNTPLFQHEVEPGTLRITLVADDGRQTSFNVDVPPGGEVRRVWDFERGGLAEP